MNHADQVPLALYAIHACDTAGRAFDEPKDPLRTPFELDRHRIIESTAFRRLEGKTQVFAPSHHDHFRTRLTHTLEVAQVARWIATALRANAALVEAIALAHDLGHPPFGHAGEAALKEAMADAGGFNHNTHSLRVVDYLEHPFPSFRGLNLTAPTRAGLATHATRYDMPAGFQESPKQTCGGGPSVEAQIASLADRIAYNGHDLEDAIGAGLVGLEELSRVTLWHSALEKTRLRYPVSSIHAIRRVVLDIMLDHLLDDVITTSQPLLDAFHSAEEVQAAGTGPIRLSRQVDRQLVEWETFLVEHVYRQEEVARMDARGREMILVLFEAYRRAPDLLPRRFSHRLAEQGRDRVICDYIAGMTDRFCEAQFQRLHRG